MQPLGICKANPAPSHQVVYALVTHMGGGYRSEVDGAVMVLRLLAERQPEKLAKYVVFLKGVLDYLHNLSLQHVRELFAILTRLSAEEEVRRRRKTKAQVGRKRLEDEEKRRCKWGQVNLVNPYSRVELI